jgi:hypothetical protein
MKIENLQATLSNRRGFTKALSLASAGMAAFLAKVDSAEAATITDADIVNFALNLEYLEAEFYTVAVTGKTIDQFGIGINGNGSQGATTGGGKVTFATGSTLALSASEIMEDEQEHVTLLRGALTALGLTPVAKPAINLNALGTGFESQEAFITLARAFEDVGVSAYGGAAPLIQNNAILATAARILSVEAYHAGNLRLHAALYQVPTKALDSQDIVPPPSGSQFFTDNNQGLSVVRTPGQVLSIVYGGKPNVASGGFFPAGVNGAVNTSST